MVIVEMKNMERRLKFMLSFQHKVTLDTRLDVDLSNMIEISWLVKGPE